MGKILIKTEDGWVASVPLARSDSGWARAKTVYRKTSATTWTPLLVVDNTPPSAPIITFFDRVDDKLKITIQAPANSDVTVLRVKVSKRISASTDVDFDYLSTPDGTDTAWSEWKVAPGQTRTKLFPISGTLTNNTLYYATVWAIDSSKNFSSPSTASAKFVLPSSSTVTPKSVSVSVVDSCTFRRTTNEFWRDSSDPRVGGTHDDVGMFFYSSKISTTLKNAKELTRAQIKLQRLNDRDFTGQARFYLLAHTMTGYSKVDIDSGGRVLYTSGVTLLAGRGQSITVDIPDEWLPDLLSGKIKGFGLFSQLGTGKPDDPYRSSFYGETTSSGRVYLEFRE